MNSKIAIVFVALCHFAVAQKLPKMTKEKSNLPKTDKLVVYQIYTRLFGNLNTTNKFYGSISENGTGKFNDINDKALQELKKFGVSHVWYTGVIEHATMTDYSKFGIPQDNPLVVKGIAGSPYAIKDYYDVNPDLAVDVKNRMKEFEALVERSHKNGLKVLIDCVPNHVARSYHSDKKPKGIKDFGEEDDKRKTFANYNNFYYLPNQDFVVPDGVNPPVEVKNSYYESPAKATGNDVFSARPSINDWFETIKLNYGVDYLDNRRKHFDPIPSTWLKMRDILTYWTKKGVDGFRCDMAEMVPFEFWGWVIPEIKKINPDVIFIAEIYNPQTYKQYIFEGKFDYLYDKVGLYDALRRLMEGGGNANDITSVWQKESGDFSNRMLRFLENHDEQRIASRQFADDPFKAIPAMVVSAALHTGPVMLYFGQEVGVKPVVSEGFSGEDGRTTMFDYWGVTEFQNWVNNHNYDGGKLTNEQKSIREIYANILKFVHENEAVKEGKFYDLQYVNGNGQSVNYNDKKIFSYLRFTDNQKLLFICNFDLEKSYSTTVFIPQGAWEMMKIDTKVPVSYTNKAIFEKDLNSQIINQQTKAISTKESLRVNLAPNSVLVFEMK
ncbi:Alpha-1,4-glucan:maltose-1-phosphate maltosyltransferase [Emticicia aquatica]|uniref:Alpha-1,4-glucan:maltose-1-phosphate maltosyltransferase n=1 Tax=Emticicia aquatica TaxID=1681835 RepID=A0ABM9AN92_9BACT|nr:alpha-amylase family glycosyl hydrolase [Emticicia aquatica]CAH0995076.1 Alpha-1,4-glucan:maltose-1-phosphate maltosyltransferase [Emticicia aquatica]